MQSVQTVDEAINKQKRLRKDQTIQYREELLHNRVWAGTGNYFNVAIKL
jgi:hypothetical protein